MLRKHFPPRWCLFLQAPEQIGPFSLAALTSSSSLIRLFPSPPPSETPRRRLCLPGPLERLLILGLTRKQTCPTSAPRVGRTQSPQHAVGPLGRTHAGPQHRGGDRRWPWGETLGNEVVGRGEEFSDREEWRTHGLWLKSWLTRVGFRTFALWGLNSWATRLLESLVEDSFGLGVLE